MRLFVAINLSPGTKEAVSVVQERLRESGVEGSYTQVENLHLTLAFIGETDRLDEVVKALETVDFPSFEIRLDELGSFRDLLWLDLGDEPRLTRLARDVRDALTAQGIPFDGKPFRPHITIARRARYEALPSGLPHKKMTVNRVSLMQSERIKGRLTYTERYGRDASTSIRREA